VPGSCRALRLTRSCKCQPDPEIPDGREPRFPRGGAGHRLRGFPDSRCWPGPPPANQTGMNSRRPDSRRRPFESGMAGGERTRTRTLSSLGGRTVAVTVLASASGVRVPSPVHQWRAQWPPGPTRSHQTPKSPFPVPRFSRFGWKRGRRSPGNPVSRLGRNRETVPEIPCFPIPEAGNGKRGPPGGRRAGDLGVCSHGGAMAVGRSALATDSDGTERALAAPGLASE
jgi:hypothetical protein